MHHHIFFQVNVRKIYEALRPILAVAPHAVPARELEDELEILRVALQLEAKIQYKVKVRNGPEPVPPKPKPQH